MRPRRRLKKFLLWFSVLILLVIGALCYVAWDILTYGRKRDTGNADVAIVLGAAAWDKKPSPVFEERINHAITLYKKKRASHLIFTGGFGDRAPMAESEVARDYAIAQGVSPSDIFIENTSHSTMDNIRQARSIMDTQGWKSAFIVSDPLHMKRAMTMAGDQKIKALGAPTPTSMYKSKSEKAEFLAREVWNYLVYLAIHN